MGKPYFEELRHFYTSYQWAASIDISNLAAVLSPSIASRVAIIGSGGSFSLAQFIASLHESATGRAAWALTPLEAVQRIEALHDYAILILSAEGKNKDIIGAFRSIAASAPAHLAVFCLKDDSPLVSAAQTRSSVRCWATTMPWEKDGYLATNSLLASATLAYRAYGELCSDFAILPSLPNTLEALIHPSLTIDEFLENLYRRASAVMSHGHLMIMHDGRHRAGALDLESKLIEAGISTPLVNDFRNFAHGRHLWLALNQNTTGIVSLAPRGDKLANSTLALLPPDLPSLAIDLGNAGSLADLAGLFYACHLVGIAAKTRGIDPGRPAVPDFGRALYQMDAFGADRLPEEGKNAAETLCVYRKTGVYPSRLPAANWQAWHRALQEFRLAIQGNIFRGIVLDYDGTLCDRHERWVGIRPEIADELNRMLAAGVRIGIATGRGKSVRTDLQNKIEKRWHDEVLIGYYNGAAIGQLSNANVPQRGLPTSAPIIKLAARLRANTALADLIEIDERSAQLSIRVINPAREAYIWRILSAELPQIVSTGLKLLKSSHSWDVIPADVSKLHVVEELYRSLQDELGTESDILCIGDCGLWPGNDSELLSAKYSLSVDQPSGALSTAWNLTPAGLAGAAATVYLLRQVKAANGTFTIALA